MPGFSLDVLSYEGLDSIIVALRWYGETIKIENHKGCAPMIGNM